MIDKRGIKPGAETTLQFHPEVEQYELVGSVYPLWPADAMKRVAETKTIVVDFHTLPILWSRTPPHNYLVLQVVKRLGTQYETVRVLAEFD